MVNYKKAIAAGFMAAAILAANILPAQAEVPAAKIAIIDVQKVVKNSTAAKQALDTIQKKRDEFQSAIDKQEEELKEKDQKLAKEKGVLTPDAFEKKRKEFQQDVLDVQQSVQKKRAALDTSYTKVLAEIQKTVLAIIETLSEDQGFDIALPSSQVLYGKDALDISDEVLKRLNKELPEVDIDVKE